jgi:hypothetical protein
MQLCSLFSYAPYFLQTQVVNLAYVAFAVLVIIVITVANLVLTLYPNIRKRSTIPGALPPHLLESSEAAAEKETDKLDNL